MFDMELYKLEFKINMCVILLFLETRMYFVMNLGNGISVMDTGIFYTGACNVSLADF